MAADAASAWRQASAVGGLEAEQRHGAVADELVEPPARLLHRLADDGEIAVEQEDDVVGQAVVGKRGKAPDVAEQHGDLLLAAGRRLPRAGGQRPLAVGGEQRQHGEVVGRPQLAGEAHVRAGMDTRQRRALQRSGRRQVVDAGRHPDAAGRAAALAAADRIVRDAADAARLENGRALRHAHDLAAFVADLDQVAAGAGVAQAAQRKRCGNSAKSHGIGELQEDVLGRKCRGDPLRRHACGSGRPASSSDRLAGIGETQKPEHRNQHGCYQQPGGGGRVPIAVAQPEMQAEAAMRPDHEEREDLLDAGRGRDRSTAPGPRIRSRCRCRSSLA